MYCPAKVNSSMPITRAAIPVMVVLNSIDAHVSTILVFVIMVGDPIAYRNRCDPKPDLFLRG